MDRSHTDIRCGWPAAGNAGGISAKRPERHRGLTVLELLTLMAILALLAGLLLPAIGAARESARRIECVSRLSELGIALHHHHSTAGVLPAGWKFDPANRSAYGWAVSILPYLGQTALADRIDGGETIDHPDHGVARTTSLPIMLCPSDVTEPTFMLFKEDEDDDDSPASPISGSRFVPTPLLELPTASYVGVFGTIEPDDHIPAPLGDGAFLENRCTRFCDFQRGLSYTLLVGERTMAQVPSTWLGVSLAGEDAAARLVGSALEGINNPLADECDFSSRHPGGTNFLWGDGHVSFVSDRIDLREYHQSARLRP